MDERIRPLRGAVLALLALSLFAATPWLGLETIGMTIVAVIIAASFFKLAADRTSGSRRPEYYLFAGWAGSEAVIAACIVITGGAESPALAWLAIPIVTLSARFSLRGVVIGVVVTELMLLAAIASSGWNTFAADPVTPGATGVLIIAVAILSSALMFSDSEHRSEAVIDPLTGLLNRAALKTRTLELSQHSEFTAEPVGVIVADIDHFKRINDQHGHAVGDEVLKDIAYVMRTELRAFDLAYRIGGEEFLILLPGANIHEAEEFARDLHRKMSAEPRGGQPVTMSFGVAASAYGDIFEYDSIFEAADAALYRAKDGGRDQVCTADHVEGMRTVGGSRHVHI